MSKSTTPVAVIPTTATDSQHRVWCTFDHPDGQGPCKGNYYCARRLGWVPGSKYDEVVLTRDGATIPALVVTLISRGQEAQWVDVEVRPEGASDISFGRSGAGDLGAIFTRARQLMRATEVDADTARHREQSARS